jgi:uncharacterized protein GlcG (DUF336 family)
MLRSAIMAVLLVTLPVMGAAQDACVDGALANGAAQQFAPLAPGEIDAVVRAAARSLAVPMTIAVVDRTGHPLALFRKDGADPANDERALGVARAAALFSHNQAPLSSRTVRYLSGLHYPAGVTNASSAALYGIENTNRGCDLNVAFNDGKSIAPSRALGDAPCDPFDTSGCGKGIVTGKRWPDDPEQESVTAGGIPLYRIVAPGLDRVDEGRLSNGHLIGAIGVIGIDGDPQLEEFASLSGAFGSLATAIAPVPAFPLPDPGNVFIDGVRLPFVGPQIRLTFNDDGLPSGVERLDDTQAGSDQGSYVLDPRAGGCAPTDYLAGPIAGSALSIAEVDGIVMRAVAKAKRTRAAIRLPMSSYTRMVIAVGDVDGSILALYRMPDATVFSIDVSVAKARNVVYFSGSDPGVRSDLPGVPAGTAVSNRTIAFGAQPYFPSGINSGVFGSAPGPFYPLFVRDLEHPCSQGSQAANANQNGIVFFAGSSPLYRNGAIVGGLGVSGDGIEQDDYVTYAGAGPFLPPQERWADRVKLGKVRLPMFKFPRQPEGVRECSGGPCS